MQIYEVRPRGDKRGVEMLSEAAVRSAVGKFCVHVFKIERTNRDDR